MLRIDVKLPLKYTENDIKEKILSIFPIKIEDIERIQILKLSLDLTNKKSICEADAFCLELWDCLR